MTTADRVVEAANQIRDEISRFEPVEMVLYERSLDSTQYGSSYLYRFNGNTTMTPGRGVIVNVGPLRVKSFFGGSILIDDIGVQVLSGQPRMNHVTYKPRQDGTLNITRIAQRILELAQVGKDVSNTKPQPALERILTCPQCAAPSPPETPSQRILGKGAIVSCFYCEEPYLIYKQ